MSFVFLSQTDVDEEAAKVHDASVSPRNRVVVGASGRVPGSETLGPGCQAKPPRNRRSYRLCGKSYLFCYMHDTLLHNFIAFDCGVLCTISHNYYCLVSGVLAPFHTGCFVRCAFARFHIIITVDSVLAPFYTGCFVRGAFARFHIIITV